MNQVAAVARPSAGLIASRTPAAVATPLPPLNLKKTGYRWPRKTAIAASATALSSRPWRGPRRATSHTASHPLNASPTRVRSALFLLPLLRALVPPGFFEPYERGSARPIAALTITANDTDPI